MTMTEITTDELILLLNAMMIVETGCQLDAYDEESGGVGPLLVTPGVVDELNEFFGIDQLKPEHFTSPAMSRWAVLQYARIHGYSGNAEEIARCWKGGPYGPQDYSTIDYWIKVSKLLEQQGVAGFYREN